MTESVATRPAATVLLVRDGKSGLEVFMVVRHHKIDFLSGALVFPGGKVDAEDFEIAADPLRCGATGDLDAIALALRVAALRETFEECGVLLARPRGSRTLVSGARGVELGNAKGSSFGQMLTTENLELALDTLTPFAHWITPPIMPKRFDTHFYIVAAPEDQLAVHDGSESVDSIWINPAEALSQAEAGKYVIVLATRLNLQMLARSADAATALADASVRRIVTCEPVPEKTATGYNLTIPIEAGYDGHVFAISAGVIP